MKIALAQLNPTVGDLDGNTARMVAAAEEAAQLGADLVVYAAHTLTGAPLGGMLASQAFVSDARAHAERFAASSPVTAVFTCPVPVEDEDGDLAVMPELLIAGPEGMDSFGVPMLSKDGECPVVELDGEPVAILLEGRFSEDMADESLSALVEMAATTLDEAGAAPAAWSSTERLGAVARGCRAWVATVNLCGAADAAVFAGNTTVFDPQGQLVEALGIGSEGIAVIDTADARGARREALPGAGLHPDEIAWEGLVCATRDYIAKNGFSDAVVGVSGGLDSAVVTAIAVDALGAEHVHGVLMPGPYTSVASNEDAAELCANLGVETLELPIGGPLDALNGALAGACGGAVEGLAEENLQARIRMVYLMALSNAHGWIVLNTGNKSEAAMGFSTLYGDTCGAFAPIGDVYKTDVYDLARWRMGKGASIPERCLTKPPSAELNDGGVDADRLPPYDALDDLLFDHVEGGMDAAELVAQGHDAAMVADALHLVKANEYKRRAEPPAPCVRGTSFAARSWPVTNRWDDAI